MKLFVEGRKNTLKTLQQKLPNKPILWFHAASLGEYEQGLPLIEAIKKEHPNYGILLTFFSPSGFEVRKNNTIADVTVYLPLDLPHLVKAFLNLVNPKAAFFIKYEFWPNYLKFLNERNVPTFLVSGIFRENQLFFKSYGGLYRKSLKSFDYFFVQNETSKKLIESLGYSNVLCSGDTRFDRVAAIVEENKSLDFVESFKGDNALMIIGSSWPKDEEILLPLLNQSSESIKFLIAPHNIKNDQIQYLKNSINKKTILYSEKDTVDINEHQIMIVDTVGLLTKMYRYADWAYVGGGFGNPGVHNVLEPAVFGMPVIIGSNYNHFAEATDLVDLGGCISIKNSEELQSIVKSITNDQTLRNKLGSINQTYIQ
ncbi:MAG: 3-deoxy-D-manno-octulosonic acid transferase, partial [Flavobacterium sp.]